MRVYEAIVQGVESIGVEAAFGGAGENAGMMIALKHSKTIRPVMTQHEQAASLWPAATRCSPAEAGVDT
jgi:acetolactate synthase-1/2/3 large subunit